MALAKVIAGPILRRVEATQVSVWVACSQNFNLKLRLYDGAGAKASPRSGASSLSDVNVPEIPTSESEAVTMQVGPHLFIGVVTARPTVNLVDNKVYSYNVEFDSSESVLELDLRSDGFLEDGTFLERPRVALGYGKDILPSFSMPNTDPAKLFVAQASCRKMHGHGHDALAHLDKIIESNKNDPVKRPQSLYLTGDQVYADDVPGPLLNQFGAIDGFTVALHDNVKLEKKNGSPVEVAVDRATWPPYRRQKLTTDTAGFTGGSSRNHVISFSEYCMLYLCYWNIRAWNVELVKEVKKIQTDNKNSVLTTVAKKFIDTPDVPGGSCLKKTLMEAISLPRDLYELTFDSDAAKIFVPDGVGATEQEKNLDAWLKKLEPRVKNEFKEMAEFAKTLPKVSRVLANVPCYMIFDDHEVTDDWFLTKRWNNGVLSKNLGRDMIRNGLMAYALFQDWGNVPDEYVRIPKADEDADLVKPRTLLIRKMDDFCQRILLPAGPGVRPHLVNALEDLIGLGTPDDEDDVVRWHYQVPTGPTTTFVLDTRTRRQYDSLNTPPGLISEDALDEQLPSTNPAGTVPFTFVVSAAPMPGLASFEQLVQPASAAVTGLKNKSERNPGILDGLSARDYEAWGFHPASMERLLKRLSEHEKVIIFSGDVHYGFASVLDYWRGTQATPKARIVTFTSSALKNEEFGQLQMYRSAIIQKLLTGIGDNLEKLGWESRVLSVNGPASIKNRQRLRSDPAVVPVAGWIPGTTINRQPDFRWRLKVIPDTSARASDPVTSELNLSTPTTSAQGYENIVMRHLDRFITKVHRTMVWPSNVGLLTFTGSGNTLTAVHEYLFVQGSRDIAASSAGKHVKHETRLTPGGTDTQRPELP